MYLIFPHFFNSFNIAPILQCCRIKAGTHIARTCDNNQRRRRRWKEFFRVFTCVCVLWIGAGNWSFFYDRLCCTGYAFHLDEQAGASSWLHRVNWKEKFYIVVVVFLCVHCFLLRSFIGALMLLCCAAATAVTWMWCLIRWKGLSIMIAIVAIWNEMWKIIFIDESEFKPLSLLCLECFDR